MRAVIGIDRKIKRAWLDVLLDHLAQTTDHEELRRFMDERLAEELPGAASRAKSVGISPQDLEWNPRQSGASERPCRSLSCPRSRGRNGCGFTGG